MSESEYKIADTKGRFLQVVKQGRHRKEVGWSTGRIILSNKRVILLGKDGKQALPLTKVTSLTGRYDVNQTVAEVSDYVSIRMQNESVYLLSLGSNTETFELKLFGAMLDQTQIRVKHPAVRGGVVQEGEYGRARLKIETESEPPELNVALASGTFVRIEIDDVGHAEAGKQDVDGTEEPILKVEHTEGETSVETYFAGDGHTLAVLESLFNKGIRKVEGSIDLSETEKQVLMGLYSGVSPFEIPDFLGMDVDEVEEIYDRLIELDVLEELRQRKEVSLKTRGRNIASEVINEQ